MKQIVESSSRYKIALRYWTKRIDGVSNTQSLVIEGDFSDFSQKIIEHWENYRFGELAEIAKSSKNIK